MLAGSSRAHGHRARSGPLDECSLTRGYIAVAHRVRDAVHAIAEEFGAAPQDPPHVAPLFQTPGAGAVFANLPHVATPLKTPQRLRPAPWRGRAPPPPWRGVIAP